MRSLDRCEQYWDLISASLDGGLIAEEQARLELVNSDVTASVTLSQDLLSTPGG